MLEGFLLGVIVTAYLAAGAFFLKFWRHTRDRLFLAFAVAFFVEALNRVSTLFLPYPNEGNPVVYLVRLFAFLLIAAAIRRRIASRSGQANNGLSQVLHQNHRKSGLAIRSSASSNRAR